MTKERALSVDLQSIEIMNFGVDQRILLLIILV